MIDENNTSAKPINEGNDATHDENKTPASSALTEALLTSSITAALAPEPEAPLPSVPTDINSGERPTRKRKKVIFCKHKNGCTNYAREGGYCIKHGGGKRCSKDGCDTRCYALGFCFKHGNEVFNSSEYEEHHHVKKAKCKKCTKVFEAPICFFSTMDNIPCSNIVQGKKTKAFCEIHSRQILLALKENTKVTFENFELPNLCETKNHKKFTCYSNKKKLCDIDGCKSLARKKGKCQKHALKNACTIDGCAGKSQSRGLCGQHGGGRRCKLPKCFKVASLESKFCPKHVDEDTGVMIPGELKSNSIDNDMILPDIKAM